MTLSDGPTSFSVTAPAKRTSLPGLIIGHAIESLLPDVKVSREAGSWGLLYQLGYQLVFRVCENGAVTAQRDVMNGYGTAWTDADFWRNGSIGRRNVAF